MYSSGPVERERVAGDGRDGPPLRLARIEVGGGEHDLVAAPPAGGIEHFDAAAAALGSLGQLAPGMLPVAVQAERAAHQHDAAVAHRVDVLAGDLVGEGDRSLPRIGLGLAADLQLATAQVDPLGGKLEVAVVGEPELAVDGQAAQRRGADVEHDLEVAGDRDRVAFARHLAAGPGGRIGPAQRPHRDGCGVGGRHGVVVVLLGTRLGAHAEQQAHRNKQSAKKLASWPHDKRSPLAGLSGSRILVWT
jgi:hypothetical protein